MFYSSIRGRVLLAASKREANSADIANAIRERPESVRQAISNLRKEGYLEPNEEQGEPVRLTSKGREKVEDLSQSLEDKTRALRIQLHKTLFYRNPFATAEQ